MMNRYIKQLVDDLDIAIAGQIALRGHLDILGESEACETEGEFPLVEKRAPLSHIIGFDKCFFPPENKLTDDQVVKVYTHILYLLDNYNFFLDFPDKIDVRIKYLMILDIFDDETTYSNSNVTILEFCNYDYDTCPFGLENCQCKMYEELF